MLVIIMNIMIFLESQVSRDNDDTLNKYSIIYLCVCMNVCMHVLYIHTFIHAYIHKTIHTYMYV